MDNTPSVQYIKKYARVIEAVKQRKKRRDKYRRHTAGLRSGKINPPVKPSAYGRRRSNMVVTITEIEPFTEETFFYEQYQLVKSMSGQTWREMIRAGVDRVYLMHLADQGLVKLFVAIPQSKTVDFNAGRRKTNDPTNTGWPDWW